MIDILIIGAGPAGMSAAIYARRALKKTILLEANSYGGQIINTLEIDNYPVAPHISGFDFATNLYNQAKELGAEFIFEKATSIKKEKDYFEVTTTKNTYQAKTIIIATGADNRKLGIAREDELIGKGISYCATCDGAFYKGKDVAVVGGGNTAIEDAIYLSNIVNKVYLIHRRDEFRGDIIGLEELQKKDNVEFVLNSNVIELKGQDRLDEIIVSNKNGSKNNIKVNGLFVAIGRVPESEFIANIIDTDEAGYIKANESCHTNIEGIYVAGDNRVKDLRQLVTATSDGAIAATEAVKYLQKKDK